MKIRYSMLIQWSDEDQTYVVTLPEFPTCYTHGDSYEKAVQNGYEVLELLSTTYSEERKMLPTPHFFQAE